MLTLFTIYDHPRDYPHEFVVREFLIEQDQVVARRLIARASTLHDARDLLSRQCPHLVCIPRADLDDAVIVESWI